MTGCALGSDRQLRDGANTFSNAAAAAPADEAALGWLFVGAGLFDPAGDGGPPEASPSARNFRQVGDPDESILACERGVWSAALSLRDAEDPVGSGVVDRNRALVFDSQATGLGRNGVPEIVLAPDRARRAQPGRSPVRSVSGVADRASHSRRLTRFGRLQIGREVATQRIELR